MKTNKKSNVGCGSDLALRNDILRVEGRCLALKSVGISSQCSTKRVTTSTSAASEKIHSHGPLTTDTNMVLEEIVQMAAEKDGMMSLTRSFSFLLHVGRAHL